MSCRGTTSTDTDMYCNSDLTLMCAHIKEEPWGKGVSVISVEGDLNRIATLLTEASAIRNDMRRQPQGQHRRLWREITCLHIKIAAERRRCAETFGTSRGWHLSSTHFDPDVLARQGMWGGSPLYEWPYAEADHPYLYCSRDRRAAAAIAHLYGDLDANTRAECERWAGSHGLQAEFPAEPPSWWWPGSTMLVVYTPAGEVAS